MSSLSTESVPDEVLASIEDHAERERARREHQDAVRNLRRHPVSRLLRDVASGSVPSGAELDALNLSTAARRQVEDSISSVSEVRSRGEHQASRTLADELSGKVFDSLPESQRDAGYLDEPDEVDRRGPAELAAAVRTW